MQNVRWVSLNLQHGVRGSNQNLPEQDGSDFILFLNKVWD